VRLSWFLDERYGKGRRERILGSRDKPQTENKVQGGAGVTWRWIPHIMDMRDR
jgi:hypothetical protein